MRKEIVLQICNCWMKQKFYQLALTLAFRLANVLIHFLQIFIFSRFVWIYARIRGNQWLNDRSVKASGNTRFSVIRDAFGLRWDSGYSSRPIGHCHRHCRANGSLCRRLYVCIASKDDEIIRYARIRSSDRISSWRLNLDRGSLLV